MLLLDFFMTLAGGGYATKKVIQGLNAQKKNIVSAKSIEQFVIENTDEELEAYWSERVGDPKYYDEIWKRLEAYKAAGGKYSIRSTTPAVTQNWGLVGVRQPELFDKYGRPLDPPQKFIERVGQPTQIIWPMNTSILLRMVMQSYDKLTVRDATVTAREMFG